MPVEPESLADLFASLFGKPLVERIKAARDAMEQEAARLRDETSDADRLRACEQKVNYEVALREDAEAKRARAEGERDRFRNERDRYSEVTRMAASILTAQGYECETPGDLITAVARMRADLQVARETRMEDVDYRLLREVREALGVDDARQMPDAARRLVTAHRRLQQDHEDCYDERARAESFREAADRANAAVSAAWEVLGLGEQPGLTLAARAQQIVDALADATEAVRVPGDVDVRFLPILASEPGSRVAASLRTAVEGGRTTAVIGLPAHAALALLGYIDDNEQVLSDLRSVCLDAGVKPAGDDEDVRVLVETALTLARQGGRRGEPGRDFAEMTEREKHFARLITAVDDLLQTETDVRWVAAGLRTERG